jgi:hypothetical protein
MSIRHRNSIIESYLQNSSYKDDTNKHKAVLLWASKFHKHINFVLREFTYDEIMNNTIWAKTYITEMISYFYEHGLNKQNLLAKGIQLLYRGYDKEFNFGKVIYDTGFIATSVHFHTATDFAGLGGKVVLFQTMTLPNDVPFVIIDESIADYLSEDEVLLLPGTITLEKKEKNMHAMYNMNEEFVKHFSTKSGGTTNTPMQSLSTLVEIPLTHLTNLCSKYVIWYRAIIGRPVEVLGWMQMPEDDDECMIFFKNVVMKHDASFSIKNNLIPTYQDLKKKKNRTETETIMFKSFFVHMAIYDGKRKHVDTLIYGCPNKVAEEVYDTSRSIEITEHILKYCDWLS